LQNKINQCIIYLKTLNTHEITVLKYFKHLNKALLLTEERLFLPDKRTKMFRVFLGRKVFCFGGCSHAAFADVFSIFHKGLYLFYWYFVLYHFAEVFFMTWMRLNFRQNLTPESYENTVEYKFFIWGTAQALRQQLI